MAKIDLMGRWRALRLKAEDAEDLLVVSSAAQDGVFRLGDLRFDARARRFSATLNRFVWENAPKSGPFWRVRSALAFESVKSARSKNLRRGADEAVGVLMSIGFLKNGDGPDGAIVLHFAGGGQMRLDVECIDASLTDLSEPWATPSRPDHERR